MSELKRVTMEELRSILAKAGVIVQSAEGAGGAQEPVAPRGERGGTPQGEAEVIAEQRLRTLEFDALLDPKRIDKALLPKPILPAMAEGEPEIPMCPNCGGMVYYQSLRAGGLLVCSRCADHPKMQLAPKPPTP